MDFLSSDDIKKIGKPLFLDSNGTPVFLGDECEDAMALSSGTFTVEFSSFKDKDSYPFDSHYIIGFLLPINGTITKC